MDKDNQETEVQRLEREARTLHTRAGEARRAGSRLMAEQYEMDAADRIARAIQLKKAGAK